MKLDRINDMEQLKGLNVGDIIPMRDNWAYIDGEMLAMIEEKDGDSRIFITRQEVLDLEGNPTGKYLHGRLRVVDINKARVRGHGDGRYHISLDPIEMEEGVSYEDVEDDDSGVLKLGEATAR